jgi:hypothetical protein
MKKQLVGILVIVCVGHFYGCSKTEQKSPDVSSQIRNSLDQAGLQHVSVRQDRDKVW